MQFRGGFPLMQLSVLGRTDDLRLEFIEGNDVIHSCNLPWSEFVRAFQPNSQRAITTRSVSPRNNGRLTVRACDDSPDPQCPMRETSLTGILTRNVEPFR